MCIHDPDCIIQRANKYHKRLNNVENGLLVVIIKPKYASHLNNGVLIYLELCSPIAQGFVSCQKIDKMH